MCTRTPAAWERQYAPVIAECRASSDTVTGRFAERLLLLLSTTGARDGWPHTTPLNSGVDSDRQVVFTSSCDATSPRLVPHPGRLTGGDDRAGCRDVLGAGDQG